MPEGGAWQCEPQGWRVGTWWEGPAGEGPEASGLPGFGGWGGLPAPHLPSSSRRRGPSRRTPRLRSLGPGPGLLRPLGGVPYQAQRQWHRRYWGVARGGRASSVGGVASPGPLGKLRAHPDPTAVGGFDTEPDEFSDFEQLRTALPASGSSTGECPHQAQEACPSGWAAA